MTQHRRRIDQVMDTDFTSALDSIALDDLRARREMLDDLDTELSYYRRILHGRLDLLDFELRRRSGAETRSILEALPEILADTPSGKTTNPLDKALSLDLPELAGTGRREIDQALDDNFLAKLPMLDTDDLTRIRDSLTTTEAAVSDQRRAVYDAHDLITAELTRRYRDGSASPDELLTTS
ncbi:MAG: hypothetical protein M3132_03220 [Actinomycetia bacterium]|nr:hypothetical protein [Actinomycetes bacterium]